MQAAYDASRPLVRALRGAQECLVNACAARDGGPGQGDAQQEYEEALAAARHILDEARRPLDERSKALMPLSRE